jgi:chorismate mutase-like protein
MEIEDARAEIDNLDNEMLNLMAERLSLAEDLADFKHANHMPIKDPKREQELIDNRIKQAKKIGIEDDQFVKDIFDVVMKKSREVQEKRIKSLKK